MNIQKEPLWLSEAFYALTRENDTDIERIKGHPEKFGMSSQELEEMFAPYQAYQNKVLPELLRILKENEALRIYWDEDGTMDVSDKEDKYLCYVILLGAAWLFMDEKHPEKMVPWSAKEEEREEEQQIKISRLIHWVLDTLLSEERGERTAEADTTTFPRRITSVQELIEHLERYNISVSWKYRLVYLYLNQREFCREFQRTAEQMVAVVKKHFACIKDLYEEMRQRTKGQGLQKLIGEGDSGLKLSLEELEKFSVYLSVFRYNSISYHNEEGSDNRQRAVMEIGMFVQKLVSGQAEKGLLSVTEIQAVCKALGDGSRYRILELILQKGRTYLQELSREIGLTPATVSHHISVLMDADLLQMEIEKEEKKIIYYTANQKQLEQIADTFRQMADGRNQEVANR